MTTERIKNAAARFLGLLLLFLIPFNIKKFIFSFGVTNGELDSVFLYGTDVIALVFLLVFLFFGKEQKKGYAAPVLFFIFAAISIFFAEDIFRAGYAAFRLSVGLALACAFRGFVKQGIIRPAEALLVFGASAVAQSVIGFFQVLSGESIGLRIFGEPVIGKDSYSAARIQTGEGTSLLRAYGTTPHANLLSAMLIPALVAFLAFSSSLERKRNSIFFALGAWIVSFGIVLTFSRSGWISAAVAVFALLIFQFFKDKKVFLKGAILSCVIFISLLLSLGWVAVPRFAFSQEEPSVSLRLAYNEIGIEMIHSHPLGVGIGNQVSFSEREGLYDTFGVLRAEDRQPIHNLFILATTETGIAGFLTFLFVIFPPLVLWEKRGTAEKNILLSVFFSFLIFGLFDHFFWTLNSGITLFWIFWGILAGLQKFKDTRTEEKAPVV